MFLLGSSSKKFNFVSLATIRILPIRSWLSLPLLFVPGENREPKISREKISWRKWEKEQGQLFESQGRCGEEVGTLIPGKKSGWNHQYHLKTRCGKSGNSVLPLSVSEIKSRGSRERERGGNMCVTFFPALRTHFATRLDRPRETRSQSSYHVMAKKAPFGYCASESSKVPTKGLGKLISLCVRH